MSRKITFFLVSFARLVARLMAKVVLPTPGTAENIEMTLLSAFFSLSVSDTLSLALSILPRCSAKDGILFITE
ncbi:MAG: hypothetical protein HYY56_03100 [Candidatus Omnitrophica bacterium]|nr:hypothetical protein [Candidatus Omnitrophota bacterium]